MNPNEIESRLSSLKVSQSSAYYEHKAHALIEEYSHTPSVWPIRLNYALCFSLVLSLGFNLFQVFGSKQTFTNELAAQCETGNAYRINNLPPASPLLVSPELQSSNTQLLASSDTQLQLC